MGALQNVIKGRVPSRNSAQPIPVLYITGQKQTASITQIQIHIICGILIPVRAPLDHMHKLWLCLMVGKKNQDPVHYYLYMVRS